MKPAYFILFLVLLSFLGCVSQPQAQPQANITPENISQEKPPLNVSQPEEPLKNDTRLKLIDAHVLIGCTNDADCIKMEQRLISEMNKEGIAKVIIEDPLTTTPEVDKMLLKMAERHPDRFIPFFSGFEPNDTSAISYVKTQLESGKWAGIGKIIFRHAAYKNSYSPNDPVMHGIYKLADQYGKPVHFHTEPAAHPQGCKAGVKEVSDVLEKYPNVTFIWHQGLNTVSGLDADAGCILSIEKYQNLIVEEEFHHANATYSNYTFNSKLVEEKRIVIGTDLIMSKNILTDPTKPLMTAGGATYHKTIENTRKVLANYPNETARDIGYNNILRIIGEKAS